MKCRYDYCKNGNIVEKANAIKSGKAYYCKECYEEKEDKNKILSMVHELLPSEIKISISKCTTEWIHKKGFDTKYVMYTLDYIKRNRSNLKSVYGIIYYLNNSNILSEYSNKITMNKYNKIAKNVFECDDNEVKFTYKSDTGEGWCKIL